MDGIAATVRENPAERLYAGAFWLLYGDCSSIAVPAFALNCESADPQDRWHPPDWRWPVIDAAVGRVRPLYEPLQSLRIGTTAFDALWERYIDMLSRVSRRITGIAASGSFHLAEQLSPDFFVGIIDWGQGDAASDYLKRSVAAERLDKAGIC